MVKPVHQVLFKVRTLSKSLGLGIFASFSASFFLAPTLFFFIISYLIPASETCICNQEFDNYHFASME